MTNNTLSCIDFFCSHDSVFELLPLKNNTKSNNSNNSFSNNLIMAEFFKSIKNY